jgi:hypothetical protein
MKANTFANDANLARRDSIRDPAWLLAILPDFQ